MVIWVEGIVQQMQSIYVVVQASPLGSAALLKFPATRHSVAVVDDRHHNSLLIGYKESEDEADRSTMIALGRGSVEGPPNNFRSLA